MECKEMVGKIPEVGAVPRSLVIRGHILSACVRPTPVGDKVGAMPPSKMMRAPVVEPEWITDLAEA